MPEEAIVALQYAEPFVLQCSACHYRFDSSQGEKLRNDLIAHLWSHTSSGEEPEDSGTKPRDVRAGL